MKVKLNGNDFYEVTSKFHSIDNVHHIPHSGIDLAMNIGSPLNSPTDGVVTKIVDYGHNNIGRGIFIETDDHQTVIMGHLSQVKAHVGDRVHEGDFVALSGSTGHSTGGHLHLGLKDANGHIINPDKLLNHDSFGDGFVKSINHASGNGGVIDSAKDTWGNAESFWDFIQKWHHDGFWMAMYGKSCFGVMKDFLAGLFHDIGIFIVSHGDIFFLCPAIVLMFGTFLVGRNKYTKFIVPLLFAYLTDIVIYYSIK